MKNEWQEMWERMWLQLTYVAWERVGSQVFSQVIDCVESKVERQVGSQKHSLEISRVRAHIEGELNEDRGISMVMVPVEVALFDGHVFTRVANGGTTGAVTGGSRNNVTD